MQMKLLFPARLREEVRLSKIKENYFTPQGAVKLLKLSLRGVVKLVVEGGSFIAQSYLGLPREISQIVSQALGITSSFVLNSNFSFKNERLFSIKFAKFIAVKMISMAAGVIFMTVIGRTLFKTDNMRSDILAKAVVMALTGIISICGNTFFVFKDKSE